MKNVNANSNSNATVRTLWYALLFVTMVASPDLWADTAGGDYSDTGDTVCGFFTNVSGLLTIASVSVVTIAVIFAGYQIAFAHKRIADVAPILIGGVLIGAAGQIATMLLGDSAGGDCDTSTSLLIISHASSIFSV